MATQMGLGMLAVGAGGCLGAMLRYGVTMLLGRWAPGFPHGTLWSNLLGCLLLGIVIAILSSGSEAKSDYWRLFLATGICGGFTTMSAFTSELYRFLDKGALGHAALYFISTLVGGMALFVLGLYLTRHLLRVA